MKISPYFTLICLLFLPIAAIAQEQRATADERQACEPDVNRLCSQFIPIDTRSSSASIKKSGN